MFVEKKYIGMPTFSSRYYVALSSTKKMQAKGKVV